MGQVDEAIVLVEQLLGCGGRQALGKPWQEVDEKMYHVAGGSAFRSRFWFSGAATLRFFRVRVLTCFS